MIRRRQLLLLVLPPLLLLLRPGRAAEAGDARACIQLFDAQSYEEAGACLAAGAAQRPGDAQVEAYLGRVYFEQHRSRQAIEWLKKAVAHEPRRSEYHDWLGRAYGIAAEHAPVVRQLGLALRVKAELEHAVELDPANLDAREDLIEFQIRAPALLGGSLDKARANAAELGRRDRLRGQLAHAEIARRQLGLPAAERELRAAAAEFPADPRPWIALGAACREAGLHERSFAALDAALRLDADNADAVHEFAATAARSGQRLERAEELLTRRLEHLPAGDGPGLADSHYGLGTLLERQGDLGRAREHYLAALRRDPASTAARDALHRLP